MSDDKIGTGFTPPIPLSNRDLDLLHNFSEFLHREYITRGYSPIGMVQHYDKNGTRPEGYEPFIVNHTATDPELRAQLNKILALLQRPTETTPAWVIAGIPEDWVKGLSLERAVEHIQQIRRMLAVPYENQVEDKRPFTRELNAAESALGKTLQELYHIAEKIKLVAFANETALTFHNILGDTAYGEEYSDLDWLRTTHEHMAVIVGLLSTKREDKHDKLRAELIHTIAYLLHWLAAVRERLEPQTVE